MSLNRRDFMALLGFGTGAVAFIQFVPSRVWTLPDALVATSDTGPITAEWLAAESMRLFVMNIDHTVMQLADDPVRVGVGMQQFGCEFLLPELLGYPLSRKDVSLRYIEPVAIQMAHRFNDIKPKYCFPLMLPGGIQHTARARCTNPDAALDIRYVRAYDIRPNQFFNRLDMLVAA